MKKKLKIVTALLKYDYGIKSRGESLELKAFYPAIKENVADVLPFWLEEHGYPNDTIGLQEKLIAFCEENTPDIVFFILMNDEITPLTLSQLSRKYYTMNWFADDQWRFDSFSKNIAKALCCVVTADKYSLPKYHALGCKEVVLSQWGTYLYQDNLDFAKIEYRYDVSFVGSKNIVREWYVNFLKDNGIEVECFGNGWGNGRVSFEEIPKIIQHSKINLNLSNSRPSDYRFYLYWLKQFFRALITLRISKCYFLLRKLAGLIVLGKNIEQIKARNFETPGFGGFQLSQYAIALEDYYVIGEEIAIFASVNELVRQIKYYIGHEEARLKIAKRGYDRTEKYTYKKIVSKMINEVSFENRSISG